MKTALIIFVRNPVLGKVKSRLASTIGMEKALHIYKRLLLHTNEISKDIPAEKFVFYEDYISYEDQWQNELFHKFEQEGNDLGERMSNAFQKVFDQSYSKVLIIGSDCFELTQEIILHAMDMLTKNDIVIGPATDGGYYLLGMNKLVPRLFKNKKWSTDSVYKATLREAVKLGYSVGKLPELNDVDQEADLPDFKF